MCSKAHFRNGKKSSSPKRIPCYFNAGMCVVDPINEGGLSSFLRSTYPYHHGTTVEESRKEHSTIIPPVIVANFNE